eukprot:TRINITY_DN400_c7_g1_i1.p1 TRINITY_DN400_c7_g1~~TRINITY_DN400_c7_g1_i1.p1  ORF type:complete len:250 (+),score=81.21 TRINITY_DN400_c7_g1_i1:113-751(+)
MSDTSKVVLFVDKVHQGQQQLDSWIEKQPHIGGVREIEEDGVRIAIDLRTQQRRAVGVNLRTADEKKLQMVFPEARDCPTLGDLHVHLPEAKSSFDHGGLSVPVKETVNFPDIVLVGHYLFSKQAFRWVQERLVRDADDGGIRSLLLDNFGPLELHLDAGLEPAMSSIIADRHKHPEKILVVVVREAFVDVFKKKHALRDDDLIDFRAVAAQ